MRMTGPTHSCLLTASVIWDVKGGICLTLQSERLAKTVHAEITSFSYSVIFRKEYLLQADFVGCCCTFALSWVLMGVLQCNTNSSCADGWVPKSK